MVEAGGVGVIFRVRAIGDDENLHELIQPAGGPEAIPLIAVNLVERLPNGHTAAFQLNVNQRQTIDQHRHIIAIIMRSALLGGDGVLMDDLQAIVMDALFVDELNVLALSAIPAKHLHIVLLNQAGLFENAGIAIRQHFIPKPRPFAVRKVVIIQLFKLRAQIGDEVCLFVDGKALIAKLAKQADELVFQLGFALVSLRALGLRRIFGDNGTFVALRNDIKVAHGLPPSGSICRGER